MRLTLINQFYAPDISPTAQLSSSLAEHRAAQGDQVTVVTGRAGYLEGVSPAGPVMTGPRLRIRRTWTPDLGRSTTSRRLGGYVAFLVGATLRVLLLPRQDVIVVMTTPPYVVLVALLHKALHPRTRVVLWSMDCYPDAAERLGALPDHPVVTRGFRALTRFAFRHLDHVVALDGAMAELLGHYEHGAGRPPVTVIPNWERRSLLPEPLRPGPWPGFAMLGTGGRPVILYLGNAGVGHRFETVLDAAARMQDEAAFVFIGGGAQFDELQAEVRRRRLRNVRFRGYVPKDETPALMAGAAAALITLDDRAIGIMSPSKLHSNLAAGLPILYVGPAGSNVDEAIERHDCGTSVRTGDVDGLVAAVRSLLDDPIDAAAIRKRARAAFDDAYCDERVLPQWDAVIDGATT
jgi:colanic acid biosynthesis glycosyl transferase WcaI